MKVIVINQQVVMVRHWMKWYRVARSLEDWRIVEIKKYQKPKSLTEMAAGLEKSAQKKRKKA